MLGADAGELKITSPADGSHFTEGQPIDITIERSGPALKSVTVITVPFSNVPTVLNSPPFTFRIQAPTGRIGRMIVKALGSDVTGQTLEVSISIIVDPAVGSQTVQSLLVQPPQLFFPGPDFIPQMISVRVSLSDGTMKYVGVDQLSMSSNNPKIATVGPDEYARAVAPGKCDITITYGNLSKTIPVIVCSGKGSCPGIK
jgi:hypothetical protein